MKLSVWVTNREFKLLEDVLEIVIMDNDVDRAEVADKLLTRIRAAKHCSGKKKRT